MKGPAQITIIHDPNALVEMQRPPRQGWGGLVDAIRAEAAANRLERGLPIPNRLKRYLPIQETP